MTPTVPAPRPTRDRRRRAVPSAALAVVALSATALLGGCSTGDVAARAAASQLGRPYVYGGASPRSGFDCSGLTMWAWGVAGKRLPRTAAQQYSATYAVSASQIRPGDLAFYSMSGRISHVAMYVGNGTLVQARKPGYPIERQPVGWWADHFAGYRRVR